jgi:predicted NUDIX family NTP pyrophosphohydrolase
VDLKENTELDLATGMRTLTFAVDWDKRKTGLRVELEDAAWLAIEHDGHSTTHIAGDDAHKTLTVNG